jgi:LuxR family maltose regulon positive regulatory protein
MAAARRTSPGSRRRARHQVAATSGDRDAPCRPGVPQEALEKFGAAERLQPQLVSSLALASQVTGWLLATKARLGMTGEARASLIALADEDAGSGEICNARAVICLAGGDPARALSAVRD